MCTYVDGIVAEFPKHGTTLGLLLKYVKLA